MYLDYDGVLHPDDAYRSRGRGVYLGEKYKGHTLFEHAPLLVEALAPYPAVQIVLSTSWVRVLHYSYAAAYLPPELRQRCIAGTFHTGMPRQWFMELSRAEQVLGDVRRREPAAWVAIDDDVEGWPEDALGHFVPSDGEHGIAHPVVAARLREALAVNFVSV